jgi:60S ribosomal protein uL30
MGDAMEESGKAVLRPRRPGETIKVAETVLKRRDRNLKAAADRAAQVAKIRRNQKEYKKGKLRIVRAERLVRDCATRQHDRRRLLNQKKKAKLRPPRKPQPGKVIAVCRNGRMGGSKEVKMTLKEMGLNGRHTMVWVDGSAETLTKLDSIKPFIFWGKPTFKTVHKVLHKKALFRDPDGEKGKTLLSDNVLIEKHLGDLNVLCTEDLVDTIYTCSQNFSKVTERLWPVPLGDVKRASGLVKEKKFTFGNLQHAINLKLSKLMGE